VAIEPGAKRGLGVVQMERQDATAAHGRLALGRRALVARLGPEVVAGSEQVAGVGTDADAFGSSGALEERGQLAERRADRVSGSRRVLERDLDPVARGARERFVERSDDPAEPGLEPGAHVRARMDDDAREPERLGALELVGECGHRLRPQGGVRVSEIDEIARRGGGRRARASSDAGGFAAHCRWFFRKIWTAPQPTSRPRSRARCRPPAIDMWAPISSRRCLMAVTVTLCYSASMKPFTVPSAYTTTFTLEYGVAEADMRRLYQNAKRDQWNASKDV